MTKAIGAAGAALILCGLLTGAAPAQTAAGQDQDKGQNTGQEAPPVADAGASVQAQCISENDDYKMNGKTPTFVIALENKCEQRLTCKVYVNVSSAKGSAQGQTTMVLGPKSSGAAAKKSYTIKVKMMGGISQSSRECRVI